MKEWNINDLPIECLGRIFGFLDIKSFSTSRKICKDWLSILSTQALYKDLYKQFTFLNQQNRCYRDYNDWMVSEPLPDSDKLEDDTPFMFLFDSIRSEARAITSAYFESKLAKPDDDNVDADEDWHAKYIKLYHTTNLTGLWTASYGSHGEEIINVEHKGYHINAIKVTGDVNVPAGKPTFNASLYRDRVTARGRMHLADVGYRNSRWGMARLLIDSEDDFTVLWTTTDRGSQYVRRYFFPLHFKRKKTPLSKEEQELAESQLREQQEQQANVQSIET